MLRGLGPVVEAVRRGGRVCGCCGALLVVERAFSCERPLLVDRVVSSGFSLGDLEVDF